MEGIRDVGELVGANVRASCIAFWGSNQVYEHDIERCGYEDAPSMLPPRCLPCIPRRTRAAPLALLGILTHDATDLRVFRGSGECIGARRAVLCSPGSGGGEE